MHRPLSRDYKKSDFSLISTSPGDCDSIYSLYTQLRSWLRLTCREISGKESEAEERKELTEELKLVGKKLEELKILIDTQYSAVLTREQKENYAFSASVPNEFYILWEKKIVLQKKLGTKVSTLTEMFNESVKSQLHIKASSVEERLQRKSAR